MFTVSPLTTSAFGIEEGSGEHFIILQVQKPLTNTVIQISNLYPFSTPSLPLLVSCRSHSMGILKTFLSFSKVSFVDFPKSGGIWNPRREEKLRSFVLFNSVSNFVPLVIQLSCLGFRFYICFLGVACDNSGIKKKKEKQTRSFIPQTLIACWRW